MKSKLLIVFLALVCITIWVNVWRLHEHLLEVTFLDVGQGDAAFIRFPHGGNMLIDGGEGGRLNCGEKIILPYLHRRGIRRLDIIVLTHAHSDHVGGLPAVLKAMSVGLVLDSGYPHTSYVYEEFLEIIRENKIPYKITKGGDEIHAYKDVKVQILSPPESFLEGAGSDVNNNSIVIKMTYGRINLLFCADIEKEAEKMLLESAYDLNSNVIKVPHHGSKTSSTHKFLKAVNPEIAVISVGARNPFGHPHTDVLSKYKNLGARLYRTDKNGTITITTDGKIIKAKPRREDFSH